MNNYLELTPAQQRTVITQVVMTYGDSLPFEKLIEHIRELQERFHLSFDNNRVNNFRSL